MKRRGAITVPKDAEPPYEVSQATTFIDDIHTASSLVTDELEPLIKQLAPPMDENERMFRFYRDPAVDDDDDEADRSES